MKKFSTSRRRYLLIGVPFLVSLTLIILAYQTGQDVSYIADTQQKDSISNVTAVNDLPVSSEADSLLVQSNVHIRNGDFTKALAAAERSLVLNQEKDNYKAIGSSNNKIATIHYYLGDYYNALDYFEQSLRSFEKADFTRGVASSYNNKGAIYYFLGNYPRALEHYRKAAELNETLNNQTQSAATVYNMAGIYIELDNFDQAMKHYQLARDTYKNLADTSSLSKVINGIGDIYLRQEAYDTALVNLRTAYDLATMVGDQQSLLEILLNLGEVHESLERYDEAMDYYDQARALADKLSSTLNQGLVQIAMGTTNIKKGKYAQAIDFCKRGLNIASQINTILVQEEACDCLYNAYKRMGNSSNAMDYLEQSLILKDSLHARQTADKILNMQFEKEMLLDSIADVEKEQMIERQHQEELHQQEKQRNFIIVVLGFLIIVAIAIWSRLNYVRKSKKRLQQEKDRSDHLLLNILPGQIAEELKSKGFVDAQDFESASILFTDFKSFTATASQLSPQELVQELNVCFKAFDQIISHYNIEKIKTIGDAYMAAGGVPKPDANAVKNTLLAALEMQEFIIEHKKENDLLGKPYFEMRIGIHVGPIVAGVVGVKKFQYDIWGDTVNTASRMESNGEIGRVNISKETYLLVCQDKEFAFEYRGKINAKGKGAIEMYFVEKIKEHEIHQLPAVTTSISLAN